MTESLDIPAVEKRTLASEIAERLKSLILAGRFEPGQRLPPERELARLLRVTRSTLREAMKVLETLKFVVIRQGDGVRVQDYLRAGNLDLIADLLIASGNVDHSVLRNILEARALFLVVLAQLAVDRATLRHIQSYRESVRRLKESASDRRALQEADLDCVDVLARATGNIVFIFVLNSIRGVYLRHRDVFAELYASPAAVIQGHERLLQAIENRDARASREAALLLAGRVTKIGHLFGTMEE